MELKTINSEKITPIKIKEDEAFGSDLFPIKYFCALIVAKKASGKSQLVVKILKGTTNPRTSICIISSTVNKDPIWKYMRKWADKREIPIVMYDSIYDDNGIDRLKLLVEEFKNPGGIRVSNSSELLPLFHSEESSDSSDDEEDGPREMTIVLDDLSAEMVKSKSLTALIKSHRHWLTRVIISTQHLSDCPLGARLNMDFWITFQGQPVDKLKQIWKESDVGVSWDDFLRMYGLATKERYSFFYINCRGSNEFRKNFSEKFILPPAK